MKLPIQQFLESLYPSPFTCDIFCDIEGELKKILNELKSFKGYKIRLGEKEDRIAATFTGKENEDLTWTNDGKKVPQQYLDLHNFLVEHEFVMSISSRGSRTYGKQPERFSGGWHCKISCDTKDKRTELVKSLGRSKKGYIFTNLTEKRVQVDFVNVEEPETDPQLYTFLCDVLLVLGYEPRFSGGRYPKQFIQSESS